MPFSENRKLRPRAARSGAPNKIYELVIERSECLWICVARSEAPHTQIASIEVMKSQNFDMPFSENRKLRPRAARSGAPNKAFMQSFVTSRLRIVDAIRVCVDLEASRTRKSPRSTLVSRTTHDMPFSDKPKAPLWRTATCCAWSQLSVFRRRHIKALCDFTTSNVDAIRVARSEAPHTQIAAIEVVKSQNFDMPFSENRKLRPRAICECAVSRVVSAFGSQKKAYQSFATS